MQQGESDELQLRLDKLKYVVNKDYDDDDNKRGRGGGGGGGTPGPADPPITLQQEMDDTV